MAKQRIDLDSLFKSLAKNQPGPLYVVTGSDAGPREEVIIALRRALFGTGEENIIAFGPEDAKLAAVMDEVRTASLFAPKKLVLVREAGSLLAAGKKDGSAAKTALLDYLNAPVPGTVLIMEAEKLDGRSSLVKALEKRGALLALPPLYFSRYGESAVSMASPAGGFLRHLARRRKLKLSESAGERLLELADGETDGFAGELDKLVDYLGKSDRAVSVEDVEALAVSGAGSVYPLVRAACGGRTAETLCLAENVFARGMEQFGRVVWNEASIALAIVNALSRELFAAEKTRLAGRYVPSGKMPPPQVVRAAEAVARRWGPEALERGYRLILAADADLKSSSGRTPRAIVEDLLIELGRTPQPAMS